MQKIGIVVEYNPFHNGHLYQINEIKKIFGEDTLLIVITSGDFVQRGEISYLNKWEKTEIALNYGIDLVIELPVYYSIQNAEIFSGMATRILDYVGADIQIFGAESEDVRELYKVVDLQKKTEYREKIMHKMKEGHNYSTSQRLVLEEYGYKDIVRSNNILGIEYIRIIEKENLKIKPYIIKREISDYREEEIEKNREKIVSASFLRKLLNSVIEKNENKEKILRKIEMFVPQKTLEIINEKKFINNNKNIIKTDIKEKLYEIVKYKILTDSKKKIMEIYDMTEEIYARIYNGLVNSKNHEQFLEKVKSRNFSTKRIERLILNILLNIKKRNMDFDIDYVRVLGFNDRGRRYLKYLKSDNRDNIYVNWKDIEKQIKNEKVKIEKNGFLVKNMFLKENERLNPIRIDTI